MLENTALVECFTARTFVNSYFFGHSEMSIFRDFPEKIAEETTINNAVGDEIKPCFKGRRKRERRCNAKGIDPTKTNTLAPEYSAIDFGESCRHGARYFNPQTVGVRNLK